MQTHYMELDDLRRAHENEVLTVRMELERAIDINKLKVSYLYTNQDFLFSKSNQFLYQKERETKMKLEDMQSEVALRNNHIDNLSKEIKELKFVIDDLKDEINAKSNEVQQIRVDAQREIKCVLSLLKNSFYMKQTIYSFSFSFRNKEASFLRSKEDEFNSLNAEHIKQKQILVHEFKQAQEIFKQRISELEDAYV